MPASTAPQQARVLITAASILAANQLQRDVSTDRSLQLNTASTVTNLWHGIETARPQVVLLDNRLAGKQTPQLVRDLVQRVKLPVLVRTDASEDAATLLDCIEAGALALLAKPATTEQNAQEIPSLIWNLKAAAGASVANWIGQASTDWPAAGEIETESIFAIGAGMGSTFALGNLLCQLPASSPATVVITPLPAGLIRLWIDRLSRRCRMQIGLAQDGDILQRGKVLIAPGDAHLLLRRNASDWKVQIKDGPAVFLQKPSMEMLLNSIADAPAPAAVGVLLSGAGVDGIAGLLRLRKAGGHTLSEAKCSSLFPEFSARTVQCGAAQASCPAHELAGKMLQLASTSSLPKAA